MTKTTLFPKEKYQIRKKTRLELPEKWLCLIFELYFESTDTKLLGQHVGEYTAAFSTVDPKLSLRTAKVVLPSGEVVYYQETADGDFRQLRDEEIDELVRAFEKEFQEKYEIVIRDEETDNLMTSELDATSWENF